MRASRLSSFLGFWLLSLAVLAGCSDRDGAVMQVRQALVAPGDVLGFENASYWTINSGTIVGTSADRVEGNSSLAVKPVGFSILRSVNLATLPAPTNKIAYSVFVPASQPNPYYYGATQLYVTIPSLRVFSRYLGQVGLTGLRAGAWHTITIDLPASTVELLAKSYTDLSFTIVINAPAGATGTYLIDGLGFVRQGACAGLPDGSPCDDGSACTSNDVCRAGACVGGTTVTCPAPDQCHEAGACSPATGACSNPAKPNGSACDDGNACTQADTCQAGACAGGNPVTCAAADQCHEAGVCDPSTGACVAPAKADGAACDDGNACTQADTCQAGACTGGSPVTCVAADQCHEAGACDPTTGVCSNPAAPDGTACSDGNACTQVDACQAGVCAGASPVICMAQDQCHVAGTCDPATGACTNPIAPNGTACNDGNACTQTDSCQAGACAGGNPVTCVAQDQCHLVGTCDPANGTCSNPAAADGTACNDGNACTQTDSCQAGACAGGNPVTCVAQDQCHLVGTCDPANGTCSNPAAADGTACNDGDVCTQTDTCQAGACAGGNPVTCVAQDQCHVPGTCDRTTGICTNPVAADGTACNDQNACTQVDSCQAGTCTGGSPVVCMAQDQCHVPGVCNPMTGTCSSPAAANGTACDDGRSCTSSDACQEGLCVAGNSACGLQLAVTNTTGKLQPSTTTTVVTDKPQLAGPEGVVFSAEVANTGTFVTVQGRLEIRNESSSPATVTRSVHELAYRSRATGEWVTYSAAYSDCDGCSLTPATGYSIYPYFDALTVDLPGVTYSIWNLVGTVIGPGATAAWDYTFQILVDPADVGLFLDPTRNDGIQKIFRIETGGPAPDSVVADVSSAYAGMTADFTNATGTLKLGSTTLPMTPRSSAPVPPGGSVVLDAMPLTLGDSVPMRGDAEPDEAYRLRLQNLPCFYGQAELTVVANGETVWSSGSRYICQEAPILVPQKSGPAGAQAGSLVQYTVSLVNDGREAAYALAVEDAVNGTPVPIVVTAPAVVSPRNYMQPAIATFDYVSSPGLLGPVTDVASVIWYDRNGNAYGPMTSSFTTVFTAAAP